MESYQPSLDYMAHMPQQQQQQQQQQQPQYYDNAMMQERGGGGARGGRGSPGNLGGGIPLAVVKTEPVDHSYADSENFSECPCCCCCCCCCCLRCFWLTSLCCLPGCWLFVCCCCCCLHCLFVLLCRGQCSCRSAPVSLQPAGRAPGPAGEE